MSLVKGKMTEYLSFVAEIEDNKVPEAELCIHYKIWNNNHECLGRLEKMQVGQWQSWCLFLDPDCYLSASCQDEVREKTKNLNNKLRAI